MSDRDALAYSTSSAQKSSPQRATRRNSVNDALLASPGKRGGRVRDASVMTCIFNSWNCTIGVGILAVPSAFSQTGYLLGAIMLGANMTLCLVTFLMLTWTMREEDCWTYADVISATVGRWATVVADATIFTFIFGVMVVYSQVVPKTLVALLDLDGELVSWVDNRQLFVLVTGVCIYWPMGLLPSLNFLRHISVLATAAMTYVILSVSAIGFSRLLQGRIECATCEPAEAFVPGGNTNIFGAFSTFSFALGSHTAIPPILSELTNPTKKRAFSVIFALVGFTGGLYFINGIMGYAQFGSKVCSNVTNSYNQNVFMEVAQACVILCVIGGQPIMTWQTRIALESLLFPFSCGCNFSAGRLGPGRCTLSSRRCDANGTLKRRLLASLLVLCATAVAFFVEDMGVVIEFSGAFGGGATCFALPTLCYMNSSLRHVTPAWRRMLSWQGVSVLMGLAIWGLNTGIVAYQIVSSWGERDLVEECGE